METATGAAVTAQLCPACEQPLPRPRVLCTCGHPETSHDIGRGGKLTFCCHISGQTGACKCQAFTTQPED